MSKKILIIDDDRTNIKLLKSWLKEYGYDIAAAVDGADGLMMLKRENPDLIILDVEMPRMNGFTFLTELRKESASADIPVIILTSHEENQPIFERKGISAYFIKPFQGKDLIAKVQEFLDK